DLVLLVDWAVTLRGMILDRRVNIQGAPVERDRQTLRPSAWHIGQQHQPDVRLTNINPRPEGSARACALSPLRLCRHFLLSLVRLLSLDLLPLRLLRHYRLSSCSGSLQAV